MDNDASRRRAPQWVRKLSSRRLHGLALTIETERRYGETSDRQEWLWDACLSELAYRRRNSVVPDWCTCSLCLRLPDDQWLGRRRRRHPDPSQDD